MGDGHYPISHNRIRQIYEDKDRQLWIASDGSISRYDYDTHQFVHYTIVDSTRTYNSNWAYHIFEDHHSDDVGRSRLWIATCLGGIFVVDKQKLIQSNGYYVAEQNYTMKNGLAGNFVNQLLRNENDDVWVLLYKNGIDKINVKNNIITKVTFPQQFDNDQPNYIMRDGDGRIWVGFGNGVLRFNPVNQHSTFVKFNAFGNSEILTMMEHGQWMWISTTDGVWMVNKYTEQVERLNAKNRLFAAMFYDERSDKIYLGGSDELVAFSPALLKETKVNKPVIFTAFYVNGQAYQTEQTCVRYVQGVKLNYSQRNLGFEFSNLKYSTDHAEKFAYRLEGIEEDWHVVRQATNFVEYQNLQPGKYQLVVCQADQIGKTKAAAEFTIYITAPFYFNAWAKCLYACLLVAFLLWILKFFKVRNNLKIARLDKEKTLELAKLKMDFFANVSHEFKTPLSLIVAPVNKLLQNVHDTEMKKLLTMIQYNALKINKLIGQVIDFNRADNIQPALILTRVEFVEFARSLFAIYEEGFKDKKLNFYFFANVEKINLLIDVQQIETMLNNLLTNACKYTGKGSVELTLVYLNEEKLLTIKVHDTGVGIPANELPYVFERFYQSSKTAGNKQGTGIGLYLVKCSVTQHNGTVEIASIENEGTTVSITLPVQDDFTTELSDLSAVDPHLPLILIVDDNQEVADFIANILRPLYRCELAHNGKLGLTKCLRLSPDLIIADVVMPVMDGLEMIRHIRKKLHFATTPVILLTAKDDKRTALESISLQVNAFIPKPFDPDILLSRVDQLLKQTKAMESKLRMEMMASSKAIYPISPDEKFLTMITNIIEDHIDDPTLNVHALCQVAGLSEKSIYRKIKALTGMTTVEYIRSIRLKKANILFTQEKFTVAEVMYMVGFSNHSYFTKCFQHEFGKTPSEMNES
jgi:signal transduction histidine kinase/CheY-like chemotaxis protein/AraC-like DNA-binding protein/streptogramin lyase